jgi:3-oxoacyl-[acyl-carrier-protein] synthase III
LASEVSVSLIGAGSYLPDRRISNEEMLKYLRPVRPDGRPIEPEWIVRHLGIYEVRLDYELGLHHDAGLDAADVDVMVHVTTTPDFIACQDHFRFLSTELGLRHDADLVHHNLGCAGLSSGFRTAACFLVSMAPATALVVASNCPSGYFGAEVHDSYYKHKSGLGWLAPLMFADGAGATVWRSTPRDENHVPTGLLSVRYETSPTSDSSPIRGAAACTTLLPATWPITCF